MLKKVVGLSLSLALCLSVALVGACGDGEKQDPTYIDMSGMTEEAAIAEYGYYVIDKDENSRYSAGDELHFGSYPSKLVDDAQILSALNADLTVPTAEEANGWVSYGFYDGGKVADYAWYKDAEYGGRNYRAVYLSKYRGVNYSEAAAEEASGQHAATQALNEVCWYSYETLAWRILSYSENIAYISCLDVIDYMPFKATPSGGTDNDWSQSDMRSWLNGEFLALAFPAAQSALISETELDNASSCYLKYGDGLPSTTDKIFLMSYKDMINADYGFTSTTSFHLQSSQGMENLNNSSIETVAQAMYRRRGATAYALALATEYSVTCLSDRGNYAAMFASRSAGSKSTTISSVDKYGDLSATNLSVYTVTGVSPALNIKIGKTA